MQLGDVLAAVTKLYTARIPNDGSYADEYVSVAAAFLRVAVMQADAVVRVVGLTPERLQSDRVRLEGLSTM